MLIRCIDCEAGLWPQENYYYWDGNIGPIDLNHGIYAFIAAYNCSESTSPIFFSHYITLTESAAATNSGTNTAASCSSASPSAWPSATPVPASSGASSSTAAALGGGIGGGIGGAIVLVGVSFEIWKYL